MAKNNALLRSYKIGRTGWYYINKKSIDIYLPQESPWTDAIHVRIRSSTLKRILKIQATPNGG